MFRILSHLLFWGCLFNLASCKTFKDNTTYFQPIDVVEQGLFTSGIEGPCFHENGNIYLVNFQKELPNLPVDGIAVTLRLPARVKSVTLLPDGKALKFRERDGVTTFTAPRLETLRMCAVNVA